MTSPATPEYQHSHSHLSNVLHAINARFHGTWECSQRHVSLDESRPRTGTSAPAEAGSEHTVHDDLPATGSAPTAASTQQAALNTQNYAPNGSLQEPYAAVNGSAIGGEVAPEAATAGSGAPPRSRSIGWYDPARDVVSRLECITEGQAKVLLTAIEVSVLVGTGLLIAEAVLKFRKSDTWFLESKVIFALNVGFAIPCVAGLLLCLIIYLYRLTHAWKQGKNWGARRIVSTKLCLVYILTQTISAVFWLTVNAYVLGGKCRWFSDFVIVSAFIQWGCLGTIFVVYVIWAHMVNPWQAPQDPAEPDAILMDAPFWKYNWFPVVLWCIYVGTQVGFLAHALTTQERLRLQNLLRPNEPNCGVQHLTCKVDTAGVVLESLVIGMLIFFMALWGVYMFNSFRTLHKGSYNKFRVGNISIRYQLRLRAYAIVFFITCVVLLNFVKFNTCSSYVTTWFGFLPLQVVLTVLTFSATFMYMPVNASKDLPVLQVWLQTFAWSEADKVRLLAKRRQSLAQVSPDLEDEPLFCFQTALKLFYWSCLCYEYEEEVEGRRFSLETAMGLYNLEKFELLWEKSEDTKVLVAWNRNTVVVAFRGTASLANVLADVQVWLSTHPPRRKVRPGPFSTPKVHRGFLRSWQANGLDKKVVDRVNEVIYSADIDHENVQVFITGHSLGGALATLAAYAIKEACPCLECMDLACYTFGAPRTGNHAFATSYNENVPDTWHLINDQDAVARGGKFFFVYKRPGQRVLFNAHGDLIVRPSFVEANVQRVPWRESVHDHLLLSYKRAFIAVCTAQFGRKGFQHGQEGILKLAEELPISELLGEWGGSTTTGGKGPEYELFDHLARFGTLGTTIGGQTAAFLSRMRDGVDDAERREHADRRHSTDEGSFHRPSAGGDVEMGRQHRSSQGTGGIHVQEGVFKPSGSQQQAEVTGEAHLPGVPPQHAGPTVH